MNTAGSITPQLWQRMPWHPKAKVIAELELEERKAVARAALARRRVEAAIALERRELAISEQRIRAATAAERRELTRIAREAAPRRARDLLAQEVAAELALAEMYLANSEPDPDAAEHLRVLNEAVGVHNCPEPSPHSKSRLRRGLCERHYRAAQHANTQAQSA